MGAKNYYGEVVFWDRTYGFIREDKTLDDYFCHYSKLKEMDGFKYLELGDKVRFEIGPGNKGKLQALNVVLLERED